MKTPLFEFPSYQYQIKDWDFKRKVCLKGCGGKVY